jgi:hypothetical protein
MSAAQSGWLLGATYTTDLGETVEIHEVTEDLLIVYDKYKQHAGYDLDGNPLTERAKELGRIMKKTSGYERA